MWYWDRTNGPVINWFQKIYYDWNKDGYHGVKNRFRTFFSNYSGYSGDYSLAVTNGYVITENVPIKEYAENFVTTIRKLGLIIDSIEMNPAYTNSGLSVYSIAISITSAELKKYKTHNEIIEALGTLDYVYHIEEI